jgi:hypothetical protein
MNAGDIEESYELSLLQQGLLFRILCDGDADVYLNRRISLVEGYRDVDMLRQAWEQTTRAHTILRTSFHWGVNGSVGSERAPGRAATDHPVRLVRSSGPGRALQAADCRRRGSWLRSGSSADAAAATHQVRRPHSRCRLTHHLLLGGWSVPVFLSTTVDVDTAPRGGHYFHQQQPEIVESALLNGDGR